MVSLLTVRTSQMKSEKIQPREMDNGGTKKTIFPTNDPQEVSSSASVIQDIRSKGAASFKSKPPAIMLRETLKHVFNYSSEQKEAIKKMVSIKSSKMDTTSPDNLDDWDTTLYTTEEIKQWIELGVTTPAWRELYRKAQIHIDTLKNWLKMELNLGQVQAFLAAEIDYHKARKLWIQGIHPVSYLPFINEEISIENLKLIIKRGLSLEDYLHLKSLDRDNDFTRALEWMEMGFCYEVAKMWSTLMDPPGVRIFKKHNIIIEEAIEWVTSGVQLSYLEDWLNSKVSVLTAKMWLWEGFERFNPIQEWNIHGVKPRVLKKLLELDVDTSRYRISLWKSFNEATDETLHTLLSKKYDVMGIHLCVIKGVNINDLPGWFVTFQKQPALWARSGATLEEAKMCESLGISSNQVFEMFKSGVKLQEITEAKNRDNIKDGCKVAILILKGVSVQDAVTWHNELVSIDDIVDWSKVTKIPDIAKFFLNHDVSYNRVRRLTKLGISIEKIQKTIEENPMTCFSIIDEDSVDPLDNLLRAYWVRIGAMTKANVHIQADKAFRAQSNGTETASYKKKAKELSRKAISEVEKIFDVKGNFRKYSSPPRSSLYLAARLDLQLIDPSKYEDNLKIVTDILDNSPLHKIRKTKRAFDKKYVDFGFASDEALNTAIRISFGNPTDPFFLLPTKGRNEINEWLTVTRVYHCERIDWTHEAILAGISQYGIIKDFKLDTLPWMPKKCVGTSMFIKLEPSPDIISKKVAYPRAICIPRYEDYTIFVDAESTSPRCKICFRIGHINKNCPDRSRENRATVVPIPCLPHGDFSIEELKRYRENNERKHRRKRKSGTVARV